MEAIMGGFSGSNGGISQKTTMIDNYEIFIQSYVNDVKLSFVDYFVNNQCNLDCRHCYVGYREDGNAMAYYEWENVFLTLIKNGVRTFGNVGKEPLLNWDITERLLSFFNNQKRIIPDIRYGIVTNGMLLDDEKINKLIELNPGYIDISVDGDKESHEKIRGIGIYDKLSEKLKMLSVTPLSDKVWISITLNKINKESVAALVDNLFSMGYCNYLISPYMTLNKQDELYLSDPEIVEYIKDIVSGKIIDFDKYQNLKIYLKHDCVASGNIMHLLEEKCIVSKGGLMVDEYGVIFYVYDYDGNNKIFLNYVPFDTSFRKILRVSHDGYISNCYDMFFADYKERAIGNVREKSIGEILKEEKRMCVMS